MIFWCAYDKWRYISRTEKKTSCSYDYISNKNSNGNMGPTMCKNDLCFENMVERASYFYTWGDHKLPQITFKQEMAKSFFLRIRTEKKWDIFLRKRGYVCVRTKPKKRRRERAFQYIIHTYINIIIHEDPMRHIIHKKASRFLKACHVAQPPPLLTWNYLFLFLSAF